MKVTVVFEIENDDAVELDEGMLFDYFAYMHSFGGRPSSGAIKAMACQFKIRELEVTNEEAEALSQPTPSQD